METLKLQNISKYYTTSSSIAVGLSNVNLTFDIGEFVAVTGESGSGKSTLAKILGGTLPYETGELYVNGSPTSHYDRTEWERYRRDTIAFVSQDYGILVGNTVLENIESALRLSGLTSDEARSRALAILKEVELDGFERRKAGKLSSGQKQRLSIARALAKPSKILIADEPTGNLDRENSEKIVRLLARAAEERLVILITHEFDEVCDLVTRRIILADGAVVTDAHFDRPKGNGTPKAPAETADNTRRSDKKSPLFPYVAAITVKARPVFTAVMCLFLALTSFITFAFLGTFTVALDETQTKIYSNGAFANGDPKRLVAMKNDGTAFSDADYAEILSAQYVKSIERYGYITDVAYHYQKGVDFFDYDDLPDGYVPEVSDDIVAAGDIIFVESGKFLRTVPKSSSKKFLTGGELPTSFYQVVSADPDYKVGDTVDVYIRDSNGWGVGEYMKLTFDVVGTTDVGEGLYFSDLLGRAFNCARNTWKKVYIPFETGRFSYNFVTYSIYETIDPSKSELSGIEIMVSKEAVKSSDGYYKYKDYTGSMCDLKNVGKTDFSTSQVVVVSDEYFNIMTDPATSDQISVTVKDYSYADRVVSKLGERGYSVISPFKLGSFRADEDLVTERIVTVCVCLAATVLVFFLQILLVRMLFSSQYEHYRLMSDIGLTSKTAKLSVMLQMLAFTVVGELVSAILIAIFNSRGIKYIVNIMKYLDGGNIMLLFAVHFLSALLTLAAVIGALGKQVFAYEKRREDMNFAALEEV